MGHEQEQNTDEWERAQVEGVAHSMKELASKTTNPILRGALLMAAGILVTALGFLAST